MGEIRKLVAGESLFETVDAQMLPIEKDKVVKLEKKQTAYLLCNGTGMILKTPMLANCNLTTSAEIVRMLKEAVANKEAKEAAQSKRADGGG